MISVLNDSMNILVTGGAGYIGSHTCKALAEASFTPIAYDSLTPGPRVGSPMGPLLGTTSLTGVGLMTSARA